MGESPAKYVTKVKILQACRWIDQDDMRVAKAAGRGLRIGGVVQPDVQAGDRHTPSEKWLRYLGSNVSTFERMLAVRGGDFKRSRDTSGSGTDVLISSSNLSNHVPSLAENKLYRASFFDLQPKLLYMLPQYFDAAVMMCHRSLEYLPSNRLFDVSILRR
jgi:hypothetical protein